MKSLQRAADTTGKMQVQGKGPGATLHSNNRSDKWDSKPRFQTTAQEGRKWRQANRRCKVVPLKAAARKHTLCTNKR